MKLLILFSLFFLIVSCQTSQLKLKPPERRQWVPAKNCHGEVINEKAEGTWSCYNNEGKLTATIEYQNGRKNGWYKSFLPNGNLDFAAEWKNDVLHGKQFHYSKQNCVYYEYNMEDGYNSGQMIERTEDCKQILIKANFLNGKETDPDLGL